MPQSEFCLSQNFLVFLMFRSFLLSSSLLTLPSSSFLFSASSSSSFLSLSSPSFISFSSRVMDVSPLEDGPLPPFTSQTSEYNQTHAFPDVINLMIGQPSPSLLPLSLIRRSVSQWTSPSLDPLVLQYGAGICEFSNSFLSLVFLNSVSQEKDFFLFVNLSLASFQMNIR